MNEKEILLKEIHHRVKNNLQNISSLLSIQSRSISDEKAKSAIKEGQSRVRSMALIHEDLYKENNYTGVQMQNYLSKLVKDIFQVYNITSQNIKLEMDIDPIHLDIDSVIPLALIANELITNALKHAFDESRLLSGKEGNIKLSFKEKGDQLWLSVHDDGKGFTPNSSSSTFGLTMVETFKEKLEAELEIMSDMGTTVILKIQNFNEKIHAKSIGHLSELS